MTTPLDENGDPKITTQQECDRLEAARKNKYTYNLERELDNRGIDLRRVIGDRDALRINVADLREANILLTDTNNTLQDSVDRLVNQSKTPATEPVYTLNPAHLVVDSWTKVVHSGHANITHTGVRVIHLPTGTVVTCGDERSQHQNRAVALDELQKILIEKLALSADALGLSREPIE